MNPGIISSAALASIALVAPLANELQLRSLFPFEEASSIEPWRQNHDRVMGGISTGKPAWTGECARFSGELSLENNGGFASFRTELKDPLDLSGFHGLKLRVRGDGRNWIVSLRTGQGAQGRERSDHNWQAPFQTRQIAGLQGSGWQDVTVPFEAFVPVFHGRYARTDGPLDRSNIVNVGLQVADGQAGEYSLEVASIDAWSIGTEEPEPGTIAAHEARTEALSKTLARSPTAESLARTLRSSERVLVVAEPLVGEDYGKLASIQRGRLVAVLEELAARDLRVIHVLGNRATLAAGRQLDPEATQALRDRWDLPTGSWSCTLIGKDGGIKKRWQRPIDPQDAFELIDVMPMRRSEARRRSGER